MAWIAKLGSRHTDNERLIYSPPSHPNSLSCVMQRKDWRINTALPRRLTSTRYSHQSCPKAPIWRSKTRNWANTTGSPFTVFLLLNDAGGTFFISAHYFPCLPADWFCVMRYPVVLRWNASSVVRPEGHPTVRIKHGKTKTTGFPHQHTHFFKCLSTTWSAVHLFWL